MEIITSALPISWEELLNGNTASVAQKMATKGSRITEGVTMEEVDAVGAAQIVKDHDFLLA